ncbi:hypothetical protein BT63DRAFT_429754 [Microthyrium microscopicum]|uniref:Uncharacterized protein n=1 Tax=Microthyrium microscopicum TaxID=703497 RepID=A0A6A6TY16_9PEZI|nr:hypothetical protein BT63DRAFT_429754 [Microthyrium microscopicum]
MSAMHSALRIREIQLLIIDQIVGDAFETNEKLNLSQHRTVLSFALCCNDFWRAALPTLWRTVPSLLSVIKTFPSTLWEDVESQLIREPQTPIYETYDLSENDSMFADDDVSHLDYQQYQLVFIRDINKEDWSRFQAHAQYVPHPSTDQ